MNPKIDKTIRGFTLVELLVALAATIILILSSSVLLFHTYRSWNNTYGRVYGDIVTDGYVAKRALGAAVRKSSVSEKKPKVSNDGKSLEVYYYANLLSPKPDSYARFYILGNELLADYGRLNTHPYLSTSVSRTVTLAHNVKSVNFSVCGTNVRMILDLDDGTKSKTVVCSALRHSE